MMKDFLAPASAKFKMGLTSAAIATLKTTVETTFTGVGFMYDGIDFEYAVTLTGPVEAFKRAMNFLFSKDKPGIVIQRSQL